MTRVHQQAKALRCRQRRLFETVILNGTLDRHRQHHRHTQHTCLSKIGPLIPKCAGAHFHFFKTRKWAPGQFFFFNVPQMVQKTSKNERAHLEKIDGLLQCALLSFGEKKILVQPCVKQRAFLVDQLGVVFMIFVLSRFHVFF